MANDNIRMIGEIDFYSFENEHLPKSVVPCDGRLLTIKQNQGLYALIGTSFGGNGTTTFAVPDLRGRVPMHLGNSIRLGQSGGEEQHSLSAHETPRHTHQAYGSTATADLAAPGGNFWASNTGQSPFSNASTDSMANDSVTFTGEGTPHENMSPFTALNFGINTQGIFPNSHSGWEGFVSEITMFAGNFEMESNWVFCDGRLIQIAQNTALFAIIGTTYGGNGTTNFALPDLRGRAPMHKGKGNGLSDRELGMSGGSETVTLNEKQLAVHVHQAVATAAASDTTNPIGGIWALGGGDTRGGVPFYSAGASTVTKMNKDALNYAGGGGAHNNMPPYIGINYLICVRGIFPSRD